MIQTISQTDFTNAFRNYGRTDNFSYEALDLLFDYFNDLETDIGEQIELDVIAICCDYAEDTVENIISNYSIEIDADADADDIKQNVIHYLSENTSYIGETNSGLVYAGF